MATEVLASSLFCGPDRGLVDNAVLRHDNGVVTEIAESTAPVTGRRSFVVPAFVNAHDHARPTASSFGAVGMPLESWILRSALGTPVDPYLSAASALARSARAGCGSMMIHYTRPSGKMPLVEEARAIGRAASDVGIRIAFAIAVRDQNPIVYGDGEPVLASLADEGRKAIEAMFVRAPMSPREYIELTDAIASAIAGPKVDVQLGPAGVQWCSKPLLEAVAENSARTGRRIHMHLLETIYQRAWADQNYPQGIVRYLNDIGFLSDRLTLAHCIHARPDELEMIAASGARIVTNFSSNMHLRSGLGPIAAAHACGCGIAVGVDGLALDEDDDALRVRYGEQIFEIDVSLDGLDWNAASLVDAIEQRFHRRHEELYTYASPGQEVVFVNARVAAVGEVSRRDENTKAATQASPCKPQGIRKAWFGGWRDIPVYAFDALQPDHSLEGPAIIEAETTTVLIDSGDRISVNALGWLDIVLR